MIGCKGRSRLLPMEVTEALIPRSHCGQAELYWVQCSLSSPRTSFSHHTARDDLNYTLNVSLGFWSHQCSLFPKFCTTLTHIIRKSYTAGVFSQVIPTEHEGHLDILLQPTGQCFCERVYVQEAFGCDMEGLQVMVSICVTEVSFSRCVHDISQREPSLRGDQRHTEIKSFTLQCYVRTSSACLGKDCLLVLSCWLCAGRVVWGEQPALSGGLEGSTRRAQGFSLSHMQRRDLPPKRLMSYSRQLCPG